MTVMYGVFDEEESMYILYAEDFYDADLFVKERGLGNRLEIDMVDLEISGKTIMRLNKLSDENEQLKQQLASINRLIDNKIDEFKNGDYGDLPYNTIHMFLDLKREIGDV